VWRTNLPGAAGRQRASTCRIAARRLRCPRRDAGAIGDTDADSARERDTGERRAALGGRSEGDGAIAAKRLIAAFSIFGQQIISVPGWKRVCKI
jgi:hypothetical protein